jgi:membrane associated rhomboid family serine protease
MKPVRRRIPANRGLIFERLAMAYLQDSRPPGPGQPLLNAPASVLWLIGALLATHAIRVLLPGDLPDVILLRYAFIPERYSGAPEFAADTLFQRALPFVSHIFLHANLGHVFVNSLWLLAFGPVVARRLGALKFLSFFLLCGVAGAAAHLAVYWGSVGAVVGASGAIAGLMGGGMRLVYSGFYGLPLAPIFSQRIVVFSLMWTAVNVVTGVVGFGAGEEVMLVAWVVHLGGYFAGLFAIALFDRPAPSLRGVRED